MPTKTRIYMLHAKARTQQGVVVISDAYYLVEGPGDANIGELFTEFQRQYHYPDQQQMGPNMRTEMLRLARERARADGLVTHSEHNQPDLGYFVSWLTQHDRWRLVPDAGEFDCSMWR